LFFSCPWFPLLSSPTRFSFFFLPLPPYIKNQITNICFLSLFTFFFFLFNPSPPLQGWSRILFFSVDHVEKSEKNRQERCFLSCPSPSPFCLLVSFSLFPPPTNKRNNQVAALPLFLLFLLPGLFRKMPFESFFFPFFLGTTEDSRSKMVT